MDRSKPSFHPSNLISGPQLSGQSAHAGEIVIPEVVQVAVDRSFLSKRQREADECRERLEHNSLILANTMYQMALDLRLAHVEKYAANWGMSFEEFAEKKLRIGFRTAYDMVNVGQFIIDYGIGKSQAELSGQTKLREISRFVEALPEGADKQQEVSSLLVEAQNTPVLKLKEKLKEKKYALRGDKGSATFTYCLPSQVFKEDAARRIADAVEAAKAELSQGDQETTPEVARKVTEHVFSEWLRLSGESALRPCPSSSGQTRE